MRRRAGRDWKNPGNGAKTGQRVRDTLFKRVRLCYTEKNVRKREEVHAVAF